MDFIGLINTNKNIAAHIFYFLPLFDKMRLLMVNKNVRNIVLSKGVIWMNISLQKIECFSMNYHNLLLVRNHQDYEEMDENQLQELTKKMKQLENERNKKSIFTLESDNEVKKFLNYLIHLGLNKMVKSLDLSNTYFTKNDKTIFWITKNFPNLEALSLADCETPTNLQLSQLPEVEQNLSMKVLNLNGAYVEDIMDWLKPITKICPNLERLFISGVNDAEYERENPVYLEELKNLKNLKVLQLGDPLLNFDVVKKYIAVPSLEVLYWNGVNIGEKPDTTYTIIEAGVPFDVFPPNLQYSKPFITAPNSIIHGMNLLHLVLEKSTIPIESLKILVEEIKVDLNVPILQTDRNNFYGDIKSRLSESIYFLKYFPKVHPFLACYPYYNEPIDYRGMNDNANTAKNGFFPIHLATLSGSEDVISYLVQHGANINSGVLKTGVTPLMFACLMKNYQLIKLLIKLGSDIKIFDKKNKWNAGFYLLAKSQGTEKELDCLKLLINAGLDLNWKSGNLTIFSFCASQGNLRVLEFLLENGSGIDSCGPDLINFAVSKLNKVDERKQKELVHFITERLEKIGKLKFKSEENVDTPLSVAAITGNENLIQFLLEECDTEIFLSAINQLDSYGKSPLHYVCLNILKFTDGLAVAQKLITCGADIFLKDKKLGATPLLFSCLVKMSGQAQQNQGFRRNERNEIGYNTVKNAELSLKLVKLLLENTNEAKRKDLVNLGDDRGFTPLHAACFLVSPDLVNLLIQNGADVNALDELGQTPAIILCRTISNQGQDNRYDRNVDKVVVNQFEELLLILKKAGANFKIKDKRNKTALLHLSSNNFSEPEWIDIMEIDSQDQLDHQDNKGRTPLLRCVHHSNANFAVGLVKRGANVNFVNKCGTTPLFFSMIIQAFSGTTKLFCPIKNLNNRKYWEYPFESNLFSILFPISWYKSTVPKSRKTNWSPPRHYSSRELILFFLDNSDLELEFNNFLGTTILMLSSMVDTQDPKIFEKTIKILSEKVNIKEISKKVDIFGSNVCHYTSRLPSSYFFELTKASNKKKK
eukprot:TRINITY_DN1674_c0_g2_i2.p1 TRINITY_DN1674_c0_g2~~TRINITY_DN1674_c0_g2_i2.p1  ORF type:complete len:1045 (+),score=250.09 TRINITY_DN1674_c0_g2_i2:88-3222(+)